MNLKFLNPDFFAAAISGHLACPASHLWLADQLHCCINVIDLDVPETIANYSPLLEVGQYTTERFGTNSQITGNIGL